MKCIYCGSKAVKKNTSYSIDRDGYHLYLSSLRAYVCSKCGEKFFPEREVKIIQELLSGIDKYTQKLKLAVK